MTVRILPSPQGMQRSVKQLYIVWVCLRLFITNFSILIRAEVNPKLFNLDISDYNGVCASVCHKGGVPCAVRALCTRCAKSWLFSTTGSSVSSED